jgi:hypothetical protein
MHHLIATSWVRCYGRVVVAQLLWHFIEPQDHCCFITCTIPWCFLDELVCCGQSRLVNSGTMEWSHSQTLWFICFQHSSLLEHLTLILASDVTVGHLICPCDWMAEISNWSWSMAMAPLHCEGFIALICILAFWRLHCRIVCGLHCVCSAFLVLHSLLLGSFRYQHSVHLHFSDWIFWSLFIHVLPMLGLVFSSYVIDSDCQCYDWPYSCCFLSCHHHGRTPPSSAWLSQDQLMATLFIS